MTTTQSGAATRRRGRRRLRPERARRGDHARAGRSVRSRSSRLPTSRRRRRPVGRADPARLHPRRVQRDPSVRPDLAVLRDSSRPRDARPALDRPAGGAWPPARRRLRGAAATATSTRRPRGLGADGDAYRRLFGPLVDAWADARCPTSSRPFHVPLSARPRALRLARFGLWASSRRRGVARGSAATPPGHCSPGSPPTRSCRLTEPISAAAGLVLGARHTSIGWPFAEGGAREAAAARSSPSWSRSAGGSRPGRRVGRMDDLPRAPGRRCSTRRPARAGRHRRRPPRRPYRRQLERLPPRAGRLQARHRDRGPDPVAQPGVARRRNGPPGRHVRGDRAGRGRGRTPAASRSGRSCCSRSRACSIRPARPAGRHTVWAYCHVPNGSTADMPPSGSSARSSASRPGFRERILAIAATGPAAIEALNPNYVGGDIGGGLQDLGQLFTRPAVRLDPYSTPDPSIFLCSASTPPGRRGSRHVRLPRAARSALRHRLRG